VRGIGSRRRRGGRGNGDERRAIQPGIRHAEREVHRAGAQRRHADARAAGQLTRGIGHQRGDRLVAREHELDAHFPRSLDEVQDLAARQAEHPLDARVAQGGRKHVGAGRHQR
jgi:hypothetical protein